MSSLFKAISDPTRLRILSALQAGVLCVCDLAASLSMTVSAVSHQLSRLRAERLVEARRDGKTIYYSFSDDHVATIFTYAKDHVAEGGRP
jgi:ArsR family transcriptional regulator